MSDHSFPTPETTKRSIAEDVTDRLYNMGYVMVSLESPHSAASDIPGFVTSIFRRLDDPSQQAFMSLNTQLAANKTTVCVSFKKCPLPETGLQRLFSIFSARAQKPAEIVSFSAEDFIAQSHSIEKAPPVYIALANLFGGEMDTRFFVKPEKSNNRTTVVEANFYKNADDFFRAKAISISIPRHREGRNTRLRIQGRNLIMNSDTAPIEYMLASDFLKDSKEILTNHIENKFPMMGARLYPSA